MNNNIPENKSPLDASNPTGPSQVILSDQLDAKDALTEVYLRTSLDHYLEFLLTSFTKEHRTFSVVFVDLDRFKKFNDIGGHLFGDEVLKYVGSSLRLNFQDVPCKIFRYGGDEFLIIFLDKTARETKQLIQTLRHNMAHRPLIYKGKFHKVTASFGIASFPHDADSRDGLIRKADLALYSSKMFGRDCVTIAGEISQKNFTRLLSIAFMTIFYGAVFLLANPIWINLGNYAIKLVDMQAAYFTRNMDSVMLKDGRVLRGTISGESYTGLTITTKIKKMPVSIYLNKSTILDKTYGLKTSGKKEFEAFVNQNPNPHQE